MNGRVNATPKSTFNATGTTWVEAAFSTQGSFGGGLSMIDGSSGYLLNVQDSGGTLVIRQGTVGSSSTERMRIDSIGNVGIGTSSPSTPDGKVLHISHPTSARIHLTDSDLGEGALDGLYLSQIGADSYLYNFENGFMIFSTNNAERMRITSAGNVGIGTLTPSGRLDVRVGSHNRLTVSDDLYSGTVIGRRLADDNYATLSFNAGGASFPKLEGAGENFAIFTGNATRISLNSAGVTYIQFAPTQDPSANANALDDYEEGTWTPALTGGSPTYTVQNGWYTKIGNVVTAWCTITITAKSASGIEAGIQGLPFSNNGTNQSLASWGREYLPAGILPSGAHGAFASVEGTIAYIRNASGSFNTYTIDSLASSGSLTFGVTYRTAT
jgi:hypothetical protein